MTKSEWIKVLDKARSLAEGKNEMCFQMFGFLLEGLKSLPERHYYDGETEEEDEEDGE